MASLEVVFGEDEAVIILDNAPCHNKVDECFENFQIRLLPAFSTLFLCLRSFLCTASEQHFVTLNTPEVAAGTRSPMYQCR